jgi:hypothetical protein
MQRLSYYFNVVKLLGDGELRHIIQEDRNVGEIDFYEGKVSVSFSGEDTRAGTEGGERRVPLMLFQR